MNGEGGHLAGLTREYLIGCYAKGCPRPAVYKIAARWSDGTTEELKTYSLCCEECLPAAFAQAQQRQAACPLAKNETLGEPGIYVLSRGKRDRELLRRLDLEAQLAEELQRRAGSLSDWSS